MTAKRFWSVATIGLIAYEYYDDNLALAGLILAGLVYYRLLTHIGDVERYLVKSQVQPPYNTVVACTFSIEKALEHPSLEKAFEHLKAKNKLAFSTADEWRASLRDNFKTKYSTTELVHKITFHVKDHTLYVDDKPAPVRDTFYHSVTIPYVLPHAENFYRRGIEVEVDIRLLLVNGQLKLQLGHFNEQTTPQLIKPGSLSVYQTYVTLTSFPLMFCGTDAAMPLSFMNLSYFATDSHKEQWLREKPKLPRQHFWQRQPDQWREVNADAAIFRSLCESDRELVQLPYRAHLKQLDLFANKLKATCEREGFSMPKRDGESWRWPDWGREFGNQFLNVHVQNFSNQNEFAKKHWAVDYTETLP